MKKYFLMFSLAIAVIGGVFFYGSSTGEKKQQAVYENEIVREQSRIFGLYSKNVKKKQLLKSQLASARLDVEKTSAFLKEILNAKENQSYANCKRPVDAQRLRIKQLCEISSQTSQPVPAACFGFTTVLF